MGGWSIALLAGGNWNNSSNCGSRSRNGYASRGTVNANNGRRGACDIGKVLLDIVRNSLAGSVYLVKTLKRCGKIHNGVEAFASNENESKGFLKKRNERWLRN